jgi:hypothetical protein
LSAPATAVVDGTGFREVDLEIGLEPAREDDLERLGAILPTVLAEGLVGSIFNVGCSRLCGCNLPFFGVVSLVLMVTWPPIKVVLAEVAFGIVNEW